MPSSVFESIDDVASSRIMIPGSVISARASAMRCRWPPDSVSPRSPTTVSYPSGSAMMKSWASAARAAASMSASLASGFPYAMLSRTRSENRKLSSKTTPTCDRSDWNVTSRTSMPSMRTEPAATS